VGKNYGRKLELLHLVAFDESSTFDNFSFFTRIKQASLCAHKERRSIKGGLFVESQEF
jgi:hypothetical protein